MIIDTEYLVDHVKDQPCYLIYDGDIHITETGILKPKYQCRGFYIQCKDLILDGLIDLRGKGTKSSTRDPDLKIDLKEFKEFGYKNQNNKLNIKHTIEQGNINFQKINYMAYIYTNMHQLGLVNKVLDLGWIFGGSPGAVYARLVLAENYYDPTEYGGPPGAYIVGASSYYGNGYNYNGVASTLFLNINNIKSNNIIKFYNKINLQGSAPYSGYGSYGGCGSCFIVFNENKSFFNKSACNYEWVNVNNETYFPSSKNIFEHSVHLYKFNKKR